MLDKDTKGTMGRGVRNSKEIENAMRKEFGDKFVFTTFTKLSAKEQIQLIQNATVFITPPGGGSFIGMFMEHRAVMLTFNVIDERLGNSSVPFIGEHYLWDSLSNVDFCRYEVTPEEFYFDRHDTPKWAYHGVWHNGDYSIDKEKIIKATHDAISLSQRNMMFYKL